MEALPGVESVSLINHLPISGDIWTLGIIIYGRPAPPPGEQPTAAYRVVQPGYFATMKIPMHRGRDFTSRMIARCRLRWRLSIEALAKHHWPNEDPIGQRLRLGPKWMTVVGVVKNVKQSDWIESRTTRFIFRTRRADAGFSYMTVVMRAQGDPLALAKPVEEQVRALDKDVPIAHVQSMEQVIADKLWRGRLAMTLLGLFSRCRGVAGSAGYLRRDFLFCFPADRRDRRFAWRLGARSDDVLRMVLLQGLAVVGIGVVVGLVRRLDVDAHAGQRCCTA